MATSFNSTTGSAFLQKKYSKGFIANAISSKASKALAMIPKVVLDSGDTYNYLTLVDEGNVGYSASFAVGQATASNSTNSVGSQFAMPFMEDVQIWRVSGKILAQTRNNSAAWVNALKFSVDSALRIAAYRKSIALYTQGWGELGVLAGVSGFTFKFADAAHIYRILRGAPVVFSSTLNTATLRSGTAINVTKVDYTSNVVTCDTALATPGGVNGDYVFISGDRQNSATPARLRPVGFPVHIPVQPVTDATISTLFGVDRSANSRNYGNYQDATTMSPVDGLITLVQTCESVGNATELVAFVSPAMFTTISKQLGTERRYVEVKGEGIAGFKTIEIFADGISCALMSDKYLDTLVGFVFDRKAFEWVSLGTAPHIVNDDNNSLLRTSDDNGVEGRVASYENLACKNPAACGQIAFAS